MSELRVGILVQGPFRRDAEITPDRGTTAEVQLLHCATAWLEALRGKQNHRINGAKFREKLGLRKFPRRKLGPTYSTL